MPVVNVKLIEGVFSPGQKRDLVQKLTEAVVQVEGENLRSVTWVYIAEVNQGELAIGGRPLTAADVHALQRGGIAAEARRAGIGPCPALLPTLRTGDTT